MNDYSVPKMRDYISHGQLDVRAYLKAVKHLQIHLETITNRIERLDCQLGLHGVRYSDINVMSTPKPDRHEVAIIEMIEYRQELMNTQRAYVATEREAYVLIELLENPRHVQVLDLYYLNSKSFRDVARIMRCSVSRAKVVHDKACAELQKKAKF